MWFAALAPLALLSARGANAFISPSPFGIKSQLSASSRSPAPAALHAWFGGLEFTKEEVVNGDYTEEDFNDYESYPEIEFADWFDGLFEKENGDEEFMRFFKTKHKTIRAVLLAKGAEGQEAVNRERASIEKDIGRDYDECFEEVIQHLIDTYAQDGLTVPDGLKDTFYYWRTMYPKAAES